MPDGLSPASDLARFDMSVLARALRPLLEDAGPLVPRLHGRHFTSWEAVLDVAEVEIHAMGDADQVALLAGHPHIGERPDRLAARSPESHAEQGGSSAVPAETYTRLDQLNRAYEDRFGFPFVEWAAGRSRTEMIPVIELRLARDRATELAAGCAATIAIARDRLLMHRRNSLFDQRPHEG